MSEKDTQNKVKDLNEVQKIELEIDMHISYELAKMRHSGSFHDRFNRALKEKEEKASQKKDK